MKRGGPLKRTPLKRSSKPLKRGKGFAASKAQREKVAGLRCVGCGGGEYFGFEDEQAVDPAHLYPRSLCPCDHAEGIIPLCRTCHRIYDDASKRAQLDLMTKLTDRGHLDAFAHYITAHDYSPITLLEHVTGETWMPLESPERAVA